MEEAYLPIREFSKLTGISREALRFYDKIGLLSPQTRRKNGYRYYATRQLDFAVLISELRALGMGLEEIKRYADERTPEKMLALFREQHAHIEAEIGRLRGIQSLMTLRSAAAEDALLHQDGALLLEEREQEPIFLCPSPPRGVTEMDASLRAFQFAADHGISISHPYGITRRKEDLNADTQFASSQLYFKVSANHNAWKEKGTYAVYHCRPGNQPRQQWYRPLLSFLAEQGLCIVGGFYEEYPLDELSIHRWEEYRMRVEVRVVPEPSHGQDSLSGEDIS